MEKWSRADYRAEQSRSTSGGHCPLYYCPNFHFLFFLGGVLLCNAKSKFLCCCCCCVLGEVEDQDRAGYQLEGIAPFMCPFCNFLFVSVGCCYCCCCVSGEVAEQRASWRALPSYCAPLQLSFSQPQPADQLWIYLLWDQLQKISTH